MKLFQQNCSTLTFNFLQAVYTLEKSAKHLKIIAPIMEISDMFAVVLAVVFFFGVYLQIKIIGVVKKNKQVAWEAQIYHSIVLILHFGIALFFETLPYMDPNIINFSGWICDIFRYIRIWGVFAISGHSLYVSIQKYIVIVHGVVGDSQRRNVALAMFVVPLIFQILWTVVVYIRSTDTITTETYNETCSTRPTSDLTSILFNPGVSCGFDTKSDYFRDRFLLYFVTEMYCTMQAIWNLIIYFNVIEAFIYLSIFRFTKR